MVCLKVVWVAINLVRTSKTDAPPQKKIYISMGVLLPPPPWLDRRYATFIKGMCRRSMDNQGLITVAPHYWKSRIKSVACAWYMNIDFDMIIEMITVFCSINKKNNATKHWMWEVRNIFPTIIMSTQNYEFFRCFFFLQYVLLFQLS